MFNRVSAETLEPRLDADFYKKEFIENHSKLKASGAVRLASLINVKKSSYGILPKSEEYVESGLPLIRGGDLSFGQINPPEVHVPVHYAGVKGKAEEGDVLILIKGACINGPEGVARISEKENGFLFNGSCYRLAFNKRDVNGYFFVAFSQTRHFLMQKKRRVANTCISYNDEESILGYLFPSPSDDTKRYIGDKVRQAMLLRALAKKQSDELVLSINKIFAGNPKPERDHRCSVSMDEISENRLDAEYYAPEVLWAENEIKQSGFQYAPLGQLATRIKDGPGGWGVSIYDYKKKGIPIIRSVNINDGDCDLTDCVYISKEKNQELIAHEAKKGSVLLSVRGTVGRSAVFNDDYYQSANLNAAVVTIDCKPGLNPYYLAAFFNSKIGNIQLNRIANGAVQLNMNLKETASNLIVAPTPKIQEEIANIYRAKVESKRYNRRLTLAAKLLVEALIEGQIDENLLISAQVQLQASDNSLDRSIMARLKTDGLDGKGQPLFPDIDQLYALLTQAAQA